MGSMMRVVIAEDAVVLREGLTRLIGDHGHEVCAAVADGDALLAAVAGHRPDAAGVGYLLKERVADVADFVAALERVAEGGTALDPEVVSQLFRASRRTEALFTLTRRERDVLTLMAEGRSNAGISAALFISSGAVEKHVASIFGKLGLPPSEGDNRRVLAVLRYLDGTPE